MLYEDEKKELEKNINSVDWRDIAITEKNIFDKKSILVTLIFNSDEEGDSFADNFLSKYEYGFAAVPNSDGVYDFYINFDDFELSILLPTFIPKEQYNFLNWHRQSLPFYITTGVWFDEENRGFTNSAKHLFQLMKIYFE